MLELLLACALVVMPADSVGPRRAVVIQNPAIDEDLQDHWLGEDKFKHFTMSFGITSFAFAGARTVVHRDGSIAVGVATGALAGVLKEAYDRKHKRPFSGRDLTWDALGIALGYAVVRQTN